MNIYGQKNIPFRNTKLSFEDRTKDLVSRLTLEEKVQQLMHHAPAIERLGIPAYDWWNEALHGVARTKYFTTVFPQAIGMAATWDTAAIRKAGSIAALEGRAIFNENQKNGSQGKRYNGLTYWSPNINIFRDPRWGRGQETYGEDPFLTAAMGVSFVSGIQGNHPRYFSAAACAKHFAVHSGPESTRHSDNVNPSPYDLWDTYLPAFEVLVKKANVQGIMCAYNAVEGQPCCASNLLMQDILRKKWGFSGYVTSDCWGLNDFVHFHKTHETHLDAAVDALIHATDLECGQDIFKTLTEAVMSGRVKESQVDAAITRLFLLRMKLGMFDPPSALPWSHADLTLVNQKKHQQHALEMARKSIVLLKNENNILPLSKNIKKIVVCGPNADNAISILGNYTGLPSDAVTVAEGIRRKLGKTCEVISETAVDFTSDSLWQEEDISSYLKTEEKLLRWQVDFFNNENLEGVPETTEIIPDMNQYWLEGASPEPGISEFYYSMRCKTILSLPKSRKLQFELQGDDGFRFYIDDTLRVDRWTKNDGAPVIYSGWFEGRKDYNIMLEHRQTEGPAYIGMRCGKKIKADARAFVEKYADADIFIFAGGISPQLEGEALQVAHEGFFGGDRTTITLPSVQKEFIKTLHEAGKQVVLVMMTGSAIAIPEEDGTVPAILNAWYGGQSAGTAVADVLFGDYNPAGRLPVTFYREDADLPPFSEYNMAGRTYRYFKGTPLYPFGYGLSYTTFQYSNMQMPAVVGSGKSTNIKVKVKNTGGRAGEEVVQCYVRYPDHNAKAPIRALKAFTRIHLKPGEEKEISFTLPADDLSLISESGEKYQPNGRVEISVGGGQPGVERATSGNVLTGVFLIE